MDTEQVGDYLSDPYIGKMFELAFRSEKLAEIYDLIVTLAAYKVRALTSKFEELEVSTSALFCWEQKTATLKYSSEDDDDSAQTHKEIFEFIFILRCEYENLFLIIFREIETILKRHIKKMCEEKDYYKYKKDHYVKGQGELEYLYEYNIESNCSINPYIEDKGTFRALADDLIHTWGKQIRQQRNDIAHEPMCMPDNEFINKMLIDGENVELQIMDILNYYIGNMQNKLVEFNLILKIFESAFEL